MDAGVTASVADDLQWMLRELDLAASEPPRAALQWALDHWDLAGPRFLALLEASANGEDRSEETAGALFYGLHLLAEKHETAALPALYRLMYDSEYLDRVLAENVTDTLACVIISLFDGDVDGLTSVIGAADIDEFLRDAALVALSYLAHTGQTPGFDMRSYLLHLSETLQPRQCHYIWSSWVLTVARLGYADLTEEVRQVFHKGFVDTSIVGFEDYRKDLRRTLADPQLMAGFAFDRVAPLTDAIGTLTSWYRPSATPNLSEAKRLEPPLMHSPARNKPFGDVGRNATCPCGSGKKYKKCCLL